MLGHTGAHQGKLGHTRAHQGMLGLIYLSTLKWLTEVNKQRLGTPHRTEVEVIIGIISRDFSLEITVDQGNCVSNCVKI